MPARDDHIWQARHNASFYATLDKGAFKDWAATVLFYTGLHYIDAFLAERRNIHPSTHKFRDNTVAMIAELRPIYRDYSALKDASFNARYIPRTPFTDKYVYDLENTHLAKIKSQLGQHIPV